MKKNLLKLCDELMNKIGFQTPGTQERKQDALATATMVREPPSLSIAIHCNTSAIPQGHCNICVQFFFHMRRPQVALCATCGCGKWGRQISQNHLGLVVTMWRAAARG